jgi:hypothetical protein
MKRTRASVSEAAAALPIMDLGSPLHKQLLAICFRTAAEYHHGPLDAIDAAQEVLLCLYCKSITEYPMGLSMPPMLDQYWHELILETEFYAKLCASIGKGSFIHHSKNTASDPEELKAIRVTAMKDAIETVTGPSPEFNPVFWPSKAASGPKGAKVAKGPGKELELFVKSINGKTRTVWVPETATVRDFKAAVQRMDNVPMDHQKLIFAGRHLSDEQTLVGIEGLKDGSTLHLVMGLRGC